MAVTKSILKITNTEAVIKVSGKGSIIGVDDNVNILLNSDLINPSMDFLSGTPPTVRIIGIQWCGEPGALYKISRNNVKIVTASADNGNWIDFVELFPPDMDNSTYDINVAITDKNNNPVQGELWIRLRKVSGYTSYYDVTSPNYIQSESGYTINTQSGTYLTTES